MNLASIIRAPSLHRDELEKFVHRPLFQHRFYDADYITKPSTPNLDALRKVVNELEIDQDPYVLGLRERLEQLAPDTVEWRRADQSLSKIVRSGKTYTHKGLHGESLLLDKPNSRLSSHGG